MKTKTKNFEKEFLQELLWNKEYEGGKVIEDEIIDHSRWSIGHSLVFSYEGKFYRTIYSVGATEYQDEGPWEDEGDEIECYEVAPVEKTITIYEEVNE